MKHNQIPIILMLVAGVVTMITTFVQQFQLVWSLFWTLVVMFSFYIVGLFFRYMLDEFEKHNKKNEMDEGEVLEKGPDHADHKSDNSEVDDTDNEEIKVKN